MPRYKLVVEYEGTRYSGWQVQKGGRTVQGAIIEAARGAFDDVGEVMGSGRTDAGVHALGQVVHLDLRQNVPGERLRFALNDGLPYDINVLEATSVPRRFHARHDATARSYLYQIARRRTAFGKPFVWWIRDTLDVGSMRRSALAIPGGHDFASFTDQRPDEGSTMVVVESIEIAEAGELLLVRIRASHFLRKMVRRIVGSLVEVGQGKLDPNLIARSIEEPRQGSMNLTAPPSGLFLEQVIYPGERFDPAPGAALVVGSLGR